MRSISFSITKVTKTILKKRGTLFAQICYLWKSIVNEEQYSNNTWPCGTKCYKKKVILFVNASNVASSMHVIYNKGAILDKVTLNLGYVAIDDIKVKVVGNLINKSNTETTDVT
ncbi:hypothetical protein [Candidatus Sneabacter namystus]|uniref:DUF721 domain-containing protein n=1 Tax=Candidatus Sneabacter namystus TaxID=2601646 RepID=A0A5C0UIR8_9RICK|nr:hypothetical protein [Candidatus Sneabacter namystus]QEK39511.1 hypothetical protein FZC37_00975 [Candidatus Sneabacter namystus]